MDNLHLAHVPAANTGMLIRKPVSQVFEAFVDPDITSQFWFTKGSGRLEEGKSVRWEWEMYGFSIEVTVTSIETNSRILVEWPAYGSPTSVEWTFKHLDHASTFVTITNTGFAGDGDAVAKQAADATEGFVLVLAGLKAYLEHGIRLNLVADRFPKGLDG